MSVRFFLFLLLLLVAFLAVFLALVATDTALSVWQRLLVAPLWLQVSYGLLLSLFSAASVFLAWRWLRPKPRPASVSHRVHRNADELQEDLLASAQAGVDVSEALKEIREQRRRKRAGEVHIAVFGEVSTGKSSLVNALLPEAQAESDPRAGTTRVLARYEWISDSGDSVVITDLPGFNLDEDPSILQEARRAHLVLFLCDSDLTQSQAHHLKVLQGLQKPLLIAVNKMDRFNATESGAIVQQITRVSGLPAEDVVTIQTGGKEDVIRQLSDGRESRVTRPRPTEISSLRKAIQRHLDDNLELMESLRDTAVMSLAAEKLETARISHREQQAQELVGKYSKRAVVGAMAAVAPGSDIVIQGVLATRLVQELCQLYEVSVKDVQIESFIRLAGGKIRNFSAIALAIAGNALKAFPGLGTLSGGMLHAVAYGLIFDSLGRAAAQTLASRGDFRPYPAAQAFEELLRENLESGAGRFAKLAVSQKASRKTS